MTESQQVTHAGDVENCDLLVVADERDAVALALVGAMQADDLQVALLSVHSAAFVFTIEVKGKHSQAPTVDPEIPMFLRVGAPTLLREDFPSALRFSEDVGTLWAAGALMRSPCVNRPSPHGLVGRCSSSWVITGKRAGVEQPSAELFSDAVPDDSDFGDNRWWWLQDAVSGEMAPWPAVPPGMGPYRARWADSMLRYEAFVVVGNSAWSTSDDLLENSHDLGAASVRVAIDFGLLFAVITWCPDPVTSVMMLIKVDPYPTLQAISGVWNPVSTALKGLLYQ